MNTMDVKQLGQILWDAYDKAPRGEQVTMVHLFGVEYSQQIKNVGIAEVIQASGIPASYKVELNKGVNLAKYVQRIK